MARELNEAAAASPGRSGTATGAGAGSSVGDASGHAAGHAEEVDREIAQLNVKAMKRLLADAGVSYLGVTEKPELRALCRSVLLQRGRTGEGDATRRPPPPSTSSSGSSARAAQATPPAAARTPATAPPLPPAGDVAVAGSSSLVAERITQLEAEAVSATMGVATDPGDAPLDHWNTTVDAIQRRREEIAKLKAAAYRPEDAMSKAENACNQLQSAVASLNAAPTKTASMWAQTGAVVETIEDVAKNYTDAAREFTLRGGMDVLLAVAMDADAPISVAAHAAACASLVLSHLAAEQAGAVTPRVAALVMHCLPQAAAAAASDVERARGVHTQDNDAMPVVRRTMSAFGRVVTCDGGVDYFSKHGGFPKVVDTLRSATPTTATMGFAGFTDAAKSPAVARKLADAGLFDVMIANIPRVTSFARAMLCQSLAAAATFAGEAAGDHLSRGAVPILVELVRSGDSAAQYALDLLFFLMQQSATARSMVVESHGASALRRVIADCRWAGESAASALRHGGHTAVGDDPGDDPKFLRDINLLCSAAACASFLPVGPDLATSIAADGIALWVAVFIPMAGDTIPRRKSTFALERLLSVARSEVLPQLHQVARLGMHLLSLAASGRNEPGIEAAVHHIQEMLHEDPDPAGATGRGVAAAGAFAAAPAAFDETSSHDGVVHVYVASSMTERFPHFAADSPVVPVGSGAFGKALKVMARHSRGADPVPVVVKYALDRVNDSVSQLGRETAVRNAAAAAACMVTEVRHQMSYVGPHANLVPFLGICDGRDIPLVGASGAASPGSDCPVMQHMAGGDLHALMFGDAERGVRPTLVAPTHLLRLLRDVAAGLTYLHGRDDPVVHRDIRSPNVFLSGAVQSMPAASPAMAVEKTADTTVTGSAPLPRAAIGDFGLACRESESPLPRGRGCVGNHRWIAPEVFAHMYLASGDVPATTASDVWMLGILAFEMANCGVLDALPYDFVDDTRYESDEVLDRRAEATESRELLLPSVHPDCDELWPGGADRDARPNEYAAREVLLDTFRDCCGFSPDARPSAADVEARLQAAVDELSEAGSGTGTATGGTSGVASTSGAGAGVGAGDCVL